MKKYRFYGGLFVTPLLITTRCSYLTHTVKNTNDYSPPLEQTKHVQAQLLAIHTMPGKKSSQLLRSGLLGLLWLWTLARFYSAEKRRRIPGWQLEGLALLKIIRTNARTEKSSGWRSGEDNWSRFYVLG